MLTFFPNVPDVPGVPSLLRDPLAAVPLLPTLVSDAIAFVVGLLGGPQWGLFLNGIPLIITADTVASFDYKQSWTVSDYPVEEGAFASYDKVAVPFDVRFRYGKGGSDAELLAFLLLIETVAKSLQRFAAVTPSRTYNSVNVTHYDYRRTSTNGVSMIVVDVWCVEVRVTTTSAFTDTKSPSGASSTEGGVVGTLPASPAQSNWGIH